MPLGNDMLSDPVDYGFIKRRDAAALVLGVQCGADSLSAEAFGDERTPDPIKGVSRRPSGIGAPGSAMVPG
jgi:hypothetical protein